MVCPGHFDTCCQPYTTRKGHYTARKPIFEEPTRVTKKYIEAEFNHGPTAIQIEAELYSPVSPLQIRLEDITMVNWKM